MNQTRENDKKTRVLGPILACFGPNLVPEIFFVGRTSTR